MSFTRNIGRTLGTLAILAVSVSVPQAAFANQTDGGGDCIPTNTPCLELTYNSSLGGAWFYADANDENLAPFHFNNYLAGGGQLVKNNAASARYQYFVGGSPLDYYAVVYYNSYYGGACDEISEGHTASRFKNVYNNDASVSFNTAWAGDPAPVSRCYVW